MLFFVENMEFKIGQTVRIKADGEEGEVLSAQIDVNGVKYTVSSREVDLEAKKILEGVKTCLEEELEAVEVKEESEEEVSE